MKTSMYKTGGLAVICFAFALQGLAQNAAVPVPPVAAQVAPVPPTPPDSESAGSEIIIRQKGDKEGKVTIEIRNGEFLVNGKPVDKFEDPNVEIEIRNQNDDLVSYYHSPFRGNYWDTEKMSRDLALNLNDVQLKMQRFNTNSNAAYLGVSSRKSETGGATVLEVTKSSPAEKAGLKKGDIITRVNDQKIESPDNLYETIHDFKPGDRVKVTLKRDGKEQIVSAVLEKSENAPFAYKYNYQYRVPPIPPMPDMRGFESPEWGSMPPKLGIKAQDSEEGKGVNVLEVSPGSSAEKAGLKKGDVITSVEGTEINSAGDLIREVRESREKASVKIKVTRNGKSQEMEIKIPRKLRTAEL